MKAPPNLKDWIPFFDETVEGDIYLEDSEQYSVQLEESRIEQVSSGRSIGAGLRFLLPRANGTRETRFASLNRWDPIRARDLAERLLGKKIAERSDPSRWKITQVEDRAFEPPQFIPPERPIRLLMEVDRTVRSEFDNIQQVSASYGFRTKQFHLFDSRASLKSEARTTIVFSVQVTVEKNGILQTGYEVAGASKGYELLTQISPLELARQAARRALNKLEAPRAKAA